MLEIKKGTTFIVKKIRKEFSTEEELYLDLRDNDFYGGEYSVRRMKKTGKIFLKAEVYERE